MINRVSVDDYRRLLKGIFIIYFVGLILGQLYVYLNLFTPLPEYRYLPHGPLGTLVENGKYRYYSLSSEPSYAAFIVIALFYSYIKTDLLKDPLFKGQNLFMFLLLVYMIISFQSSYGIVLFILTVLSYINISRTTVLMCFFSILIFILIFTLKIDLRAIDRVVAIFQQIDIWNLHSLANIDFAVYFRIAPVIYYVNTISLTDIHFYIGHGASASRNLVVPEIYQAYQGEFLGGFLPSFFYDYGIIGACLVFVFVRKFLPGIFSVPTAIFGLMLFNANFNTQLFWLIITFLCMNKFYTERMYTLNELDFSEIKR